VPADVDAAVVEGASARVRPLLMTVATTVLGLLPLMWEGGVGADVSARTAAPVVGGLWSCMLLTLLVLPAGYAMWRRGQVRASMAAVPVALIVSPTEVATAVAEDQANASDASEAVPVDPTNAPPPATPLTPTDGTPKDGPS